MNKHPPACKVPPLAALAVLLLAWAAGVPAAAAECLAERAKEAAADARLKVRQALHLDRWTAWSTRAGLAIAAELGVDHGRVCGLLDEQERRQVERL